MVYASRPQMSKIGFQESVSEHHMEDLKLCPRVITIKTGQFLPQKDSL